MRMRGESGGLCSGLSTAALRWRPHGGSGRRGRAGRLQRKAKEGGGSIRATRGSQRDAERGRAASPRRRRHCTAAAAEKNRGKELEVEERAVLQFPKIPGAKL